MPSKERLAYLGLRRGERLVRDFAEELRNARLAAGLGQQGVASAVGLSKSTVSRIERGEPPFPDFITAARLARVVGLDLSLKCFAAGGPLRDVGHVKVLLRFLADVHARIGRTLEAPIRNANDPRAWDVLLTIGAIRIGVAVETRIRDLQALVRREQAKARDDGVDLLILVIAATKANRSALSDAGDLLSADFPLGTRAVMRALRRGQAPSASGIVLT